MPNIQIEVVAVPEADSVCVDVIEEGISIAAMCDDAGIAVMNLSHREANQLAKLIKKVSRAARKEKGN